MVESLRGEEREFYKMRDSFITMTLLQRLPNFYNNYAMTLFPETGLICRKHTRLLLHLMKCIIRALFFLPLKGWRQVQIWSKIKSDRRWIGTHKPSLNILLDSPSGLPFSIPAIFSLFARYLISHSFFSRSADYAVEGERVRLSLGSKLSLTPLSQATVAKGEKRARGLRQRRQRPLPPPMAWGSSGGGGGCWALAGRWWCRL